jgi:hypothetical protein
MFLYCFKKSIQNKHLIGKSEITLLKQTPLLKLKKKSIKN